MSTLRASVIRHNVATASSAHGRADVLGAGINVASSLLMRDTIVADNRAHADGLSGDTQGGGIWNGMFPLPVFDDLHSNLHLNGVRVVHNRVSGETPAGGGIYTRDPIHAIATIVRGNVPDQCVGCTPSKHQRSVGRDRPAPHRVFTDRLRGFIVSR
jgi:hypothetical protein